MKKVLLGLMLVSALPNLALAESSRKIFCHSENYKISVTQDFVKSEAEITMSTKNSDEVVKEVIEMTCSQKGPIMTCESLGYDLSARTEDDSNSLFSVQVQDRAGKVDGVRFACYLGQNRIM